MKQRDEETRERVLRAAAQLFADRGFKKVTVRDICRGARANVAAVNYHFGDKNGLYREVLQRAIDTLRATSDAARVAGDGKPAEERLRSYIHVSLSRAVAESHADWISRLIQREIADPDSRLRRAGRPGNPAAHRGPVRHRRRPAGLPDRRRAGCAVRHEHPLAVDPLRDPAHAHARSDEVSPAKRQLPTASPSTSPVSRSQGFRRWRGAPARMEAERFSCR